MRNISSNPIEDSNNSLPGGVRIFFEALDGKLPPEELSRLINYYQNPDKLFSLKNDVLNDYKNHIECFSRGMRLVDDIFEKLILSPQLTGNHAKDFLDDWSNYLKSYFIGVSSLWADLLAHLETTDCHTYFSSIPIGIKRLTAETRDRIDRIMNDQCSSESLKNQYRTSGNTVHLPFAMTTDKFMDVMLFFTKFLQEFKQFLLRCKITQMTSDGLYVLEDENLRLTLRPFQGEYQQHIRLSGKTQQFKDFSIRADNPGHEKMAFDFGSVGLDVLVDALEQYVGQEYNEKEGVYGAFKIQDSKKLFSTIASVLAKRGLSLQQKGTIDIETHHYSPPNEDLFSDNFKDIVMDIGESINDQLTDCW